MKALRGAAAAFVAASVISLGLGPTRAQETGEKKRVKADVVQRGYSAIRDARDTMSRVTMATNEDASDVLMVAEYDDGSLAVFTGGADAKSVDHLVVMDAMNQELLFEAMLRSKTRRAWNMRGH